MSLPDNIDHYGILGLVSTEGPNYTLNEIKKAYRVQAKLKHPDKNKDQTPKGIEKANELFDQLQRVFELLSDETKRAQVDAKIKARKFQLERSAADDAKTSAMKEALRKREEQAQQHINTKQNISKEEQARRENAAIIEQMKAAGVWKRADIPIPKSPTSVPKSPTSTSTSAPSEDLIRASSIRITFRESAAIDPSKYMSDEILRRYFISYGTIHAIKVNVNKKNALIVFETPVQAENALTFSRPDTKIKSIELLDKTKKKKTTISDTYTTEQKQTPNTTYTSASATTTKSPTPVFSFPSASTSTSSSTPLSTPDLTTHNEKESDTLAKLMAAAKAKKQAQAQAQAQATTGETTPAPS